jgi:PEP-CTERM motif
MEVRKGIFSDVSGFVRDSYRREDIVYYKTFFFSCLLVLTGSVSAPAVTVALGPDNTGITEFSFGVVGNTITVDEVWGALGPGVLIFDELVASQDYIVIKNVTNNTGIDWTQLANELLDPVGQDEDASDPAQPGFVPVGYSTSNDTDGLSYAQGSGIARTSNVFTELTVDELSDARDFLDFFGGGIISGAGGTGQMSFGLRENFDTQQPFLLFQRPNERSTPVVPEPATFGLLALSLAAIGFARRRRQS